MHDQVSYPELLSGPGSKQWIEHIEAFLGGYTELAIGLIIVALICIAYLCVCELSQGKATSNRHVKKQEPQSAISLTASSAPMTSHS